MKPTSWLTSKLSMKLSDQIKRMMAAFLCIPFPFSGDAKKLGFPTSNCLCPNGDWGSRWLYLGVSIPSIRQRTLKVQYRLQQSKKTVGEFLRQVRFWKFLLDSYVEQGANYTRRKEDLLV